MRLRLKPLFGLVGLGVKASVFAAWDLNMRKGVTEISHAVYDLHMTIFWICVAIGVVFGVMFYSMYHHRKSRGAVADDFL